ncbi:hypothetical protein ASG96_21875 [Terrabacter sp. Soil810]|nr:hypothetical protein ASG96_21875 [Terrabacter sp. Soil810]
MMFAAYAIVVVGLMRISGIGYEHLFDSTSNTLRAAVLPLAVGAVLVIAFLRWARWDGVFHELQALSKGKLLASLPVVMIVVIVLTLMGVSWSQFATGQALVIALAAALVGFTEETVFRGIVLRSLRTGRRTEAAALAWTALVFGLFHLTNLALGEMGAPLQVVFAGLSGVSFYLARRLTGTLFAAMALHASWDFSTFLAGVHPGEGVFVSTAAFGLVVIYAWARHPHRPGPARPAHSGQPPRRGCGRDPHSGLTGCHAASCGHGAGVHRRGLAVARPGAVLLRHRPRGRVPCTP